uniref:Uncharacterized protein n=1 Tax=Utricularia reniformis TaxID=192314 RepID=A0A1Y0AZQ8_9LAMI|nr:hypothetical protein AEK19_MT0396 [Utricularia reniformis]ART30666.1 hypothetical protein AEK19_MT0396 [Utricularia reniformis]
MNTGNHSFFKKRLSFHFQLNLTTLTLSPNRIYHIPYLLTSPLLKSQFPMSKPVKPMLFILKKEYSLAVGKSLTMESKLQKQRRRRLIQCDEL